MFLNIINGLIVLGLCATILILLFAQVGSVSFRQGKFLDEVEHYYHKKISIKQLDSLSASINLTFTEKFQAQNLETINSGKNSVLH
jgi:hypothetical protein